MSEQIKNEIIARVTAFNAAFEEQHPCDKGDCGSVSIEIRCGRKRKIKQILSESGLMGRSWDSSVLRVNLNLFPNLGYQQWRFYKEERAEVVRKAIIELFGLEGSGVEIYVNSWAD